tara:strand:- start:753 stop:1274 length:522 start_codon:yes stop_codon:yes gene_type:complete
MGWFSDMAFGKRKKANFDKINQNYQGYVDFMGEQEGIAKQMMDPRSLLNLSRQNMLRNQQYDFASMQGNQMQKMGAMTGMSPGQTLANVSSNYNTMRGDVGKQFQSMLFDQYDRGLGLMQGVGQMKLGEGDRLTRQYMGEINEHNANINRRQQAGFDMAGLGLKIGSGGGLFG